MREYSIPHLRRSGKISIPEESFDRIREARDLHKEGLGTESVRRALRESSGGPDTGEIKERIERLSESLEKLKSNGSAADEALSSQAMRTVLARQSLMLSALFNLTEMVEELLLANGKPRKAVFEEVEGEIRGGHAALRPDRTPADPKSRVGPRYDPSPRVFCRPPALAPRGSAPWPGGGATSDAPRDAAGLRSALVLPIRGCRAPVRGRTGGPGEGAETRAAEDTASGDARRGPAADGEAQGAATDTGVPGQKRRRVRERDRTSRAVTSWRPRGSSREPATRWPPYRTVKSDEEAGTTLRVRTCGGVSGGAGSLCVLVMSGGPTGQAQTGELPLTTADRRVLRRQAFPKP